MSQDSGPETSFVNLTHRYKSRVLRLTVPRAEAFLVGDIFIRSEYPLTRLKGVFGKTVVVDIGANVGLFAIYARMNIPGAVVHCFEPSPCLQGALKENTSSFEGMHIHPVALSDHDGEARFFANTEKAGQSSLKPEYEADQGQWREEMVPVRHAGNMMDRLGLDKADILKIDTEGSEVEILESLGPWLDRVKHIYIEYHSQDDKRKIRGILAAFAELEHFRRGDEVGVLRFMHGRFS